METFGLVFETMAIRDLKVYAQSLGSEILHYRDSAGLECDAVLHTRAGEYALIEVKISQAQEDATAKTLKKLRDKIARAGKKEPSCLIVFTATGFAHKREDGVFSIPIGCMRP